MVERTAVITTLLPTYRRPKLLKKALESILAQSYPHFLIKVFDNASGDETEEVVKGFQDSRIHYLCHPKNLGLIGNFQTLLQEVKTPFFSFLSDDDTLEPFFYEKLLEPYKKYPELGLTTSPYYTNFYNQKRTLLSPPLGYLPAATASQECMHLYAILFHRRVLEKVPQFDLEADVQVDMDFITRCLVHYPSFVIDTPVMTRLFWAESETSRMLEAQSEKARVSKLLLNRIAIEAPSALSFYQKRFRELALLDFWKPLLRKRFSEAEQSLKILNNYIPRFKMCWYTLVFLLNRHTSIARNISKVYFRRLRHCDRRATMMADEFN